MTPQTRTRPPAEPPEEHVATDSNLAVIDLFAGPGGLGEGFAAYRSRGAGRPFTIAMSVEKDKHAHRTLRLRSFYRQYVTRGAPETHS